MLFALDKSPGNHRLCSFSAAFDLASLKVLVASASPHFPFFCISDYFYFFVSVFHSNQIVICQLLITVTQYLKQAYKSYICSMVLEVQNLDDSVVMAVWLVLSQGDAAPLPCLHYSLS